jgi:hypothetical protein
MLRPPGSRRKFYGANGTPPGADIGGLSAIIVNPSKSLHMLGVLCHSDGDLIAEDDDPETEGSTVTTPVIAGQFLGIRLRRISKDSTCWPVTVLYSPYRET